MAVAVEREEPRVPPVEDGQDGSACRGSEALGSWEPIELAQFLWIPWRLPKLNQLLDARGSIYTPKGKKSTSGKTKHIRALPNGYSVMKKHWTSLLAMHMRTRGFSVLPGCWDFTYLFVEPNSKFDPSNISSAAIKFIEDALVKDKRMEGDGWATVHSITCYFAASKDLPPGVLLAISDNSVARPRENELLEQAETMSNAARFHRRQRTYAATSLDNATERAAQRGGLPGSDQPVGEAPAEPPSPSRPSLRAQRAARDGRGATDINSRD